MGGTNHLPNQSLREVFSAGKQTPPVGFKEMA
jgi:hypothetical protein